MIFSRSRLRSAMVGADISRRLCNRMPMGRGRSQFLNAIIIAAGLVVASGFASLAYALLTADMRFFPLVFAFVSGVAFLLGLPVYLAARAARNDTPMVAVVMGFVVGAAIPAILIFAGPAADEASVGDTATVIHGSYTAAGWLQNLGFIGLFGLLGSGAALLFWFFVRRPNEDDRNHSSVPRPMRTTALSVAAVSFVAAAFAIPAVTADRSCHNPLRNGGNSISETASFDLHAAGDQWPGVANEVEGFGRSGNWSVRSDVRTNPNFQWLQVSLCKEPGTNIMVQGMPDNEVHFGVYRPQGGSSWERDFGVLYDRISARWPGKIVFRDGHGRDIAAPEWIAREQKR